MTMKLSAVFAVPLAVATVHFWSPASAQMAVPARAIETEQVRQALILAEEQVCIAEQNGNGRALQYWTEMLSREAQEFYAITGHPAQVPSCRQLLAAAQFR